MIVCFGLRNFKDLDFEEFFSDCLDFMEKFEFDFYYFFRRFSILRVVDFVMFEVRKEKVVFFFYKEGYLRNIFEDEVREMFVKWLEKWCFCVLEDWNEGNDDILVEED